MTTLFNTQSSNKSATYSVQDFQFRFRKLQLLAKKLELDGILIINGFDSQSNEEYDKLISWLFTGYSGNLVEKDVYLDPKFKEFVFLIRQNGASCYLEPELYEVIQRYLISIPNISIFAPTTRQMENTDDVELHKIAQFYKMTRNLDSVGVALGPKDDGKITNIEKWPLLQAYALDEVGCGFFGMNHHARDITKELKSLYEDYDRYSIYNLLMTSTKQMAHHIDSTFYIIDSTEIKRRPKITEQELNSIIRETFEFSIIKQPSIGNFPDLPQSRILFGKNSDKDFFYQPATQSFADLAVSDSKAPLHFTLEYVEPLSRLRVARTYFTSLNESDRITMKENRDEDERLLSYSVQRTENPHFTDEKLLQGYYALIIRMFHGLLEHFAGNIKDLNQDFVLNHFLKEFCTPEGMNLHNDQLIVQLKCYNQYGVEIKTNVNENSQEFVNENMCMLRIQLRNLKNAQSNELLGSVTFCDTFYIQSGAYHILTKNIPYFKCWTIDPTSSESIDKVKDVIISEELGKPTSTEYESVYLYVPSTEVFQRSGLEHTVQKVHFTLHEHGFKVRSEHWGTLLFFFKDFERVDLNRKLNRPAAVLHFKEKPILSSISDTKYTLFFAGFASSDIFLKLGGILEAQNVPFANVDEVPENLNANTALYQSGLLNERYFKVSKIEGTQILEANTFIKFLEYQEQLKINNNKDLNFKLFYKLIQAPETPDTQGEAGKVEVFFISGAYSAGKNRFAENLAHQGKTLGFKTHIFRKAPQDLPSLNNKIFVEGLLSFIKGSVQAGDKVLAVLPSGLNPKLIVDNVLRMVEFTDVCSLKAIITKINMNNFYHNSHKEISENFLTFCNAGYSQFIILDNYGTDDRDVDSLTSALRGLFAYSTIFRINGNIVQQSIAKDILTANTFDSKINKIERKKNVPFKAVEKKYVYIPFRVPLVRERIQNYLYRHVFEENNGYLFPENRDDAVVDRRAGKVEDELAVLKTRISRVNMELSKEIPYIYSITGIVRIQEDLEHVYKLSVNSNYVLEKPLPNVKGTLSMGEIKGMEKHNINYDNFNVEELGLLFYGENLDEGKIRDLLKNVIKPLKTKMKLKTREELSEDDIRNLELENRNWGLEDGVFFDGSRFRDCEGVSLPHHPKLDEIISNHLAEENARVGSMNRQIDKEWKLIEQLWE